MENQPTNNKSFYLISDAEKAASGWNMASFAKRMKKRLAKIRNEENSDSESFLLRHNYRQTSQHMA